MENKYQRVRTSVEEPNLLEKILRPVSNLLIRAIYIVEEEEIIIETSRTTEGYKHKVTGLTPAEIATMCRDDINSIKRTNEDIIKSKDR